MFPRTYIVIICNIIQATSLRNTAPRSFRFQFGLALKSISLSSDRVGAMNKDGLNEL